MAAPGLVEVPGYALGELLGQGGFGAVYTAIRRSDGQPVAVKLSLPDGPGGSLLAREAEFLKAVGPPHVPAVYDMGVAEGRSYLTLELIESPSLADVLVKAAGPMPKRHFYELATGMLTSLRAIHAAGVIHLDLKPENLFVGEGGQIRVIDFGLARRMNTEPSEATASSEQAIGTAEYMSPEQCAGEPLDERSDIYSMGVLWYEMLRGAPPFWGLAADVRQAQQGRRPESLRLRVPCGAPLSDLVARCLAKSPGARFSGVESLQSALTALAGPAYPSLPPSRAPKPLVEPKTEGLPKPQSATQTMGVVFAELVADKGRVQAALAKLTGQVVQWNGARYVIAFDHDVSSNPARLALLAARSLLSTGVAKQCLVDLASVSVRARAGKPKRLFSAEFARQVQFPSGAEGLFITRSAASAIADLVASEVPELPDLLFVPSVNPSLEHTALTVHTHPLVGREDLLAGLLQGAQRAFTASEPTVVSVTGEAGFGLTHLGSELVGRLARLPGSVRAVGLTVQESPIGTPPRLSPMLLHQLLALPGAAPADGGRELLLKHLGGLQDGSLWVAVAYTLGWVDTSHPELAPLLSAASALRFAVARGVGEVLRRCAQKQPLAIVLDNANAADEATLDALEYAAMREASVPLWVCALARPGFFAGRRTWGNRAAWEEKHELGPLAPSDGAELVRSLLWPAEHVPATLLSRLAERAQCIPRLLVELIAGLKRDGFVRPYDTGVGYYVATDELERLPDVPVLQWAVSREIEAMPPELGWHARLCAVLGGSVVAEELEGLLLRLEGEGLVPAGQLDALVGLNRLVGARLLVRHGDDRYDFRHALLRDALYKLIPEGLLPELHEKAYELYQTLDLPPEQRLPKYALHAARSGHREAAFTAYFALAERAQQAQAHLEAETALSCALDNLPTPDDPRLIDAAGLRGRMRFLVGRYEDSLKDLRKAQALAHSLGQREGEAGLLLDEAMVLDWMFNFPAAEAAFQKARSLTPAAEGLLAVRLAVAQTRSHHRKVEREACIEVGTRAAELARTFGDAGHESRMIALLVMFRDYVELGRLADAEHCGDVIVAEAAARRDLLHQLALFCASFLLWDRMRDAERCLVDLDAAIHLARETGSPALESCMTNAAEVALWMGTTVLARQRAQRAAELAALVGSVFWVYSQELLVARSWLYEGDLARVRAMVPQLRERLTEPAIADQLDGLPGYLAQTEMLELGGSNASDAVWQSLEDRFANKDLLLHERLELIEARALSAYRNGREADSCLHFERALALADASPCLMGERVRQRYRALFAPAVMR